MKNKLLRISLSIMLLAGLFYILTAQNKNSKLKETIPNPDLITINIDKVDMRNTILFSQIFKQVKLVLLETTRECLIGNIDQILIENDTIYVLDRQIAKALFVFDKTGKFIRKIGKLGNGPGEYIKPTSFAIDKINKRINVYGMGKIINYALNGDFINEIRTSGLSVKEIANQDGIIYVDHYPIPNDKNSTLLTAYDKEGNEVNTWLPNAQYNHGFQQYSGRTFHLIKTPWDIKYIRPFFDTIFSISNEQLTPYLSIETKHTISQSEMKKINSISIMELGKYYIKNADYFRGPARYTENKRLVMIQFHGPIGAPFVFLNPISEKYVFGGPKDDLTNRKIPFFSTITDDSFIYTTNINYSNMELLENVKNSLVKLDKAEKEKVLKLKPDSNPVIMFYECREDFLED